eukprot:scaffold952_cov409-Prasinococcus_capsulatus_cf.AAC.3
MQRTLRERRNTSLRCPPAARIGDPFRPRSGVGSRETRRTALEGDAPATAAAARDSLTGVAGGFIVTLPEAA